jgi:hypothetical protein
MPRQQLLDVSDGVVGDARQYFSQVRFKIKSVKFAEPIKL